jgi:hypothetical protein
VFQLKRQRANEAVFHHSGEKANAPNKVVVVDCFLGVETYINLISNLQREE